jgi:hypothetical protein
MRDWAETRGPEVNCTSWDARFRNWLRKARQTSLSPRSQFSPATGGLKPRAL